MAKNTKPLHILVDPQLVDSPEIQELIRKQHHIELLPTSADMILSPIAWRMPTALLKHVDEAVKACRSVKYPKKPKEGPTNE